MGEEDPGYLANLIFLWLLAGLGVIAIGAIVRLIGHPVGLIPGFVIAAVIMFAGLFLYYRVFLDERSLL
ncbi:hypothetical protein HWV07_15450 [Natronomonas salina]|uniref:hypothetical protein n=1 Tax=Natronomonas salina TaxID=1710540 RepID=UPI0015B6FE3E|nr:hypothetical protein [Natronomonas salina]QLD90355.1 hypothetical protein HWV07_15450 [Natronomonas salina]